MSRKPSVSIIGDGVLPADSPKVQVAENLGRALIDADYRIVCGGKGGIMEAAGRGARSSEAYETGDLVGILPSTETDVANEFIDVVIPTPLGHMRNALVAQSDAVIAIGGGAGTLCEIAFAWIYDRRIIAFRADGWSGELADRPVDARQRFPGEEDDRIFGVDSVDEAIALLARWSL